MRPVNPVVHPGDSFYRSIQLQSCGGRKRWNPATFWRAVDTLVLHVDSATDRITARAVGKTDVVAYVRLGNGDPTPFPGLVVTVVSR
ncbi:MAG: hypothetical protein IT359_10510 [Gemmatimonadaceae bacterium]|nr:hypothetical protein [Gemmatimonadaceae bacterium]